MINPKENKHFLFSCFFFFALRFGLFVCFVCLSCFLAHEKSIPEVTYCTLKCTFIVTEESLFLMTVYIYVHFKSMHEHVDIYLYIFINVFVCRLACVQL